MTSQYPVFFNISYKESFQPLQILSSQNNPDLLNLSVSVNIVYHPWLKIAVSGWLYRASFMYKRGTTHSPGRCSFSTSTLIDKWHAVVSELSEYVHYPYCQRLSKLPLSCLALFQPCPFTYFSHMLSGHRCKWTALNYWN